MTASGDELVDVIDDAGNTVGVVPRRRMREERLPHRCTYVLVFNTRGELFIHLRTATKDVYPSHWDVAIGGVLAAGETFDEGVRREVLEELGVAITVEELFPFCYADDKSIVQARVYRALSDGPFRLQAEEIVGGEFVDPGAVAERGAGAVLSGRPAGVGGIPQDASLIFAQNLELPLTRVVDRLAQNAGGFLGGVEAHRVLREHVVEPPLRLAAGACERRRAWSRRRRAALAL